MPLSMRPRVIQVDRGSRGFGLSLIYRGLDKFEEKETGIFVARVVPGGQAQKYGVKENDKIISINNKTPRNVDDAVNIIKEAGKAIKLVVVRQEDVPDVVHDDNLSLQSESMDSGWMRHTLGTPGSRTGSVRSFNTNYGRQSRPESPVEQQERANNQREEFLRQQEQYRIQQEELAQRQAMQEAEAQRQYEQQLLLQRQQAELEAAKAAQESPARANVKNIINSYEPDVVLQQIQNGGNMTQQKFEETRSMTSKTVEEYADGRKSPGAVSTKSGRYKSTISLHELGLDNYPYPEMPDGTRLTRKDEKQSLQNLNNRLAGYIDKVRTLQRDNAKLTKQIKHIEEYQSRKLIM